jgi:hypothetical protein
MNAIKYDGKFGNPAANDYGQWATGDVEPIESGPRKLSQSAAQKLVDNGGFAFVKIESEPESKPPKSK